LAVKATDFQEFRTAGRPAFLALTGGHNRAFPQHRAGGDRGQPRRQPDGEYPYHHVDHRRFPQAAAGEDAPQLGPEHGKSHKDQKGERSAEHVSVYCADFSRSRHRNRYRDRYRIVELQIEFLDSDSDHQLAH